MEHFVVEDIFVRWKSSEEDPPVFRNGTKLTFESSHVDSKHSEELVFQRIFGFAGIYPQLHRVEPHFFWATHRGFLEDVGKNWRISLCYVHAASIINRDSPWSIIYRYFFKL